MGQRAEFRVQIIRLSPMMVSMGRTSFEFLVEPPPTLCRAHADFQFFLPFTWFYSTFVEKRLRKIIELVLNAGIERSPIMVIDKTIEILSKKYSLSPEAFIKRGTTLAMQEKKKNIQIEKLEILARYGAETAKDLEDRIKRGVVPEHPAWEDLIEIKNIDSEIKEIEDDIRSLQAA